jgi:hypothetical protein
MKIMMEDTIEQYDRIFLMEEDILKYASVEVFWKKI